MEIKEFYNLESNEHWLNEIKKSDWSAGQYLYTLLKNNELKKLCGETKVLLLTHDENLVSFCTLAEEDEVRNTGLTPWIGFVYTFPKYRGHRYMGQLLNYAYETAKNEGTKNIYLSTHEIGLYEKYGYSFYKIMNTVHDEDTRVYKIQL